jgi:hypothetical protein
MFDCSWTDHKTETVGQRKSKKDQNGSIKSSGNSTKHRRQASLISSSSNSTEPVPPKTKPALLDFLGENSQSKKPTLNRTKSQSKLSAFAAEKSINASQWVAHNQASATELPALETYGTSLYMQRPRSNPTHGRLPLRTVFMGSSYNSDAEQSSPSEGSYCLNPW